MPAAALMHENREIRSSSILRWGGSIAIVATIHVVALWLISGARVPVSASNDPIPAISIDLPRPAVAKSEAAAQPAKPPAEQETPPPPPREKPAVTKMPHEPSAEPSPASRETALKLPAPPSMDWAKTVLAEPKVDEQKKAAGPVSRGSWQQALVAHINRFQRYPPGASTLGGAATVIFLISPAGRVLSVKLAASSGDPVLDRETVAMIYRASPVPAPPGVSENVTVAHTIHFRR